MVLEMGPLRTNSNSTVLQLLWSIEMEQKAARGCYGSEDRILCWLAKAAANPDNEEMLKAKKLRCQFPFTLEFDLSGWLSTTKCAAADEYAAGCKQTNMIHAILDRNKDVK